MLLNQVTRAHIAQLMREMRDGSKDFTKNTLARTRAENPYYTVLVEGLAVQIQKQITRGGESSLVHFSGEIQSLTHQIGMMCYRALELAALNGEIPNTARMTDPNFGASAEEAAEALEETRLLITKIQLERRKYP